MTTFLLVFPLAFVAALGNAMHRRTARRTALHEAGKDAPVTSLVYRVAAHMYFVVGIMGLVAWFVWATVGNPLDLIR